MKQLAVDLVEREKEIDELIGKAQLNTHDYETAIMSINFNPTNGLLMRKILGKLTDDQELITLALITLGSKNFQ